MDSYFMLINHPTRGATYRCIGGHMYFYRTVRDRTALTMEPLCNLTCIVHNIVVLTID